MRRIRKILENICLVDRILMVFMIVLFCYVIFQLFIEAETSSGADTVDVIVRTSLAAVFGYFISGNFKEGDTPSGSGNTDNPEPVLSSKSLTEGSNDLPEVSGRMQERVQVILVSSIGLVSLIILIFTGYLRNMTPQVTAVTSQLRDFVSAGIGFLVSCGKKNI